MTYSFYKGNRKKVASHCPCGKSNQDGKFVPFDEHLEHGFCHSCGKTFYPKETANTLKYHTMKSYKGSINYIKSDIFEASLQNYENNNFALWLSSTIPDKSEYLLKYFSIGTASDNSTLFWQIDISGKILNASKINYNVNGYRNRSTPPVSVYTQDEGYYQCLFGEFQLGLMKKDTPIVLVESQKSAIIGHAFYPEYIWLSTCGSNGLTKDKASILEDRTILILFDSDKSGRCGTKKAESILNRIKCNYLTVDLIPESEEGFDLVDVLLSKKINL